MKKFTKFISVILLLSSLIVISIPKTAENTKNTDININEEENKTLCLKLDNETLVLFENEKIIKKYEISISVLPGDDIFLLTEGIIVSDITEADSIAENFDG